MSICAVRILMERADMNVTMREKGRNLPHEPKSEHRYALNLISKDERHLSGSVGNYAVCKHCGNVYEVEES